MGRMWRGFRRWILAEEGGQTDRAAFATTRRGPSGDDHIVLRRPKTLDDAQSCAEWLKDQRTVVVNLSVLDQHLARRALDFLGGVVFAINGQMEEAGEGIYVLTPSSMRVAPEDNGREIEQAVWAQH